MLLPVCDETICTFRELRRELARIGRTPHSADLLKLTRRLRLPRREWQRKIRFHPHHFHYQTLYESPHFELNLIGWRSQQQSSVHDHGGSHCCVLVLDGILTNRDYRLTCPHSVEETNRFDLGPGEILTRGGREIHCCGNVQPPGVDLATLHLYSPPLHPLSERQYK